LASRIRTRRGRADIISDGGTDVGGADMIHCDDAINGENGLDLIFAGAGSDFVAVARGIKGFPVSSGTTFIRGPDGLFARRYA
jgi:hypothetical protein